MKIKLKNIILALFFAFLLVLSAQAAQTEYTIQKFPNGQTLIVKPVSQNPIVTIDTWIKTGSVDETDANSGVAHFLEHLFFKGTSKYAPGEFDTILESKGAVTNAATSKDYTHYYVTIPSSDFDLALGMHADMLLNPLIPRKELEKERLVVLEEIARGLDNPQVVLLNNLFKLLYDTKNGQIGHPYSRPVIGSPKVIESITRDDILEFYKANYTPENMYTVIVGNVNPADAVKKFEAEFGADKKVQKRPMERQYPKILPISKPLYISAAKDVKNTYMIMAFRTEKFGKNKDLYALDVLSAILGEGKSSRLNQILKEEKQLVNSISSSSSAYMQDGLFVISANFEPQNFEKVQQGIYDIIGKIKSGEITDADVQKAKNMIETSTYYERESITNISNEIGYSAMLTGDTSFYDTYLDNIKKIKRNDVISVAKKYLDTNLVAISTVVPQDFAEKKLEKPISHIKNETGGAAHVDNLNNAKILEQNPKTTKYLLENGATLIIEKNKHNSIIAISIANTTGNHMEKIPGTLNLAAALAKEGTKSYTSKELAQILDEKGIGLSLNGGNDSFSITLQTTKNELESALSLLSEVVNYPTFPKDELEKVKKLKLANIKNLEDNPMSYSIDTYKALAFEGSVYANNAQVLKKNIPLITREDIENYYKKSFEPQNLVITVVGNVEDAKMIDRFTKIFKGEGKKFEIKDYKINNFVPSKNIEKVLTKKDAQAAWLLLGYKTTDAFNDKDSATLKVINAIMGEGMSSRLFKNLRDAEGLAYQIGTTSIQGALDGTFLAYIGTNEKNLENAKKGILNEFSILQTEFVPQAELNRAKEKVLGNLIVSLETNMDNAQLQTGNAVLGRDINYLEKYKKQIESVTQADIINVANKYFSKPYIVTILKAQ